MDRRERIHSRRVMALAAMLLATFATQATALNATGVFRLQELSVVRIEDGEGHGSGILLDTKGTILTAYSLINTPLPLTVTATVTQNGKRVVKQFTDITVVGVHAKYDAAIIRIATPGGRFSSSDRVSKALRKPVEPGRTVYTISNAAGGDAPFRNGITRGIISAAEREFKGLTYVQTSVPAPPGSCGGALCDDKGQLIGMMSFKVEETEGISFAISLSYLSGKDFKAASLRKVDEELATEYAEMGLTFFEKSKKQKGVARKSLQRMAFVCYRLSLCERPDSAVALHNVGLCHYELGNMELAKVYLETAIAKERLGRSFRLLGAITEQEGLRDKAIGLYSKGIVCAKRDENLLGCLKGAASLLAKQNMAPKAAYLYKWGLTINALPEAKAGYDLALQDVSDKQFTYLKNKSGSFSLEDLDAYMKLGPSSVGSVSAGLSVGLSSVDVYSTARFKAAVAAASKATARGGEYRLTGRLSAARRAFGGVYLATLCKGAKQIEVIDLATVKSALTIPLREADPIFTAGGHYLCIYYRREKWFERWNLNTLKMEDSRPSRLKQSLTLMEMGRDNATEALAAYAEGRRWVFGLLKLADWSFEPFKEQPSQKFSGVRARPNRTLTKALMWKLHLSPSGYFFMERKADGVHWVHKHAGHRALDFSEKGTEVLSAAGLVADFEGNVLENGQIGSAMYSGLYAVWGADLFAETDGYLKKAIIHHCRSPYPVVAEAAIRASSETQRYGWLWASAHVGCIATTSTGREIIVRPLKVPEMYLLSSSARKSTATTLAASDPGKPRRGTRWKQAVDVPEKAKITVEDAPAGVTYDAATRTLSWDIPANEPAGRRLVLLNVQTKKDGESYEKVIIEVE